MKPPMDTDEFRRVGHRLVDWLADYFEGVADRPLSPDVDPKFLTELFDEPIPREPSSADAVVDELEAKLLPYCTHVNHPGYFGLITPTPTPIGILGDFVASALNQNVGSYTIGPSATAIERRTIRWLNDLIGYGDGAGGNLTSGGMTANFLGLKLARDFASRDHAQDSGLSGSWAVYVSEERHISVDKAVDAVGAGRHAVRRLPTDDDYRVNLAGLRAAIEEDLRNGIQPMCIVALAGTTNTGAVDDLPALREIADEHGMWLHADAAYGGGVLLSDYHKGMMRGLELADSITLDPHKWFYAPLDAGAILVKDEGRLTKSFGLKPSYLTDEEDTEGERYQYYVHGFEQSRRFRSLKVWMSFKRYGTDEIARWIEGNIAHAEHLWEIASAHADFECAMKPPMSAVCVGYRPKGITGEELVRLHTAVARRIEEGGRFWISTTELKGRYWFRINPVNFRTRTEHMDELFRSLVTECERQARAQEGVKS